MRSSPAASTPRFAACRIGHGRDRGSPVVDDHHPGWARRLRAKACERVGEEGWPVSRPHHDGDRSRTATAVLDDCRTDRPTELLERPARDLRPGEHAERFDRPRAGQSQPTVRVQAAQGARVVAHRLLRGVHGERRVLALRDGRDVHERVREKGLRDFVEGEPQEAVPVVVRILRPGRADRAIQRIGERAVIRVNLGGRRTEDEIRLEFRQLLRERAGERLRARIEGTVREPAEDRRRDAERRCGESRFVAPPVGVSGVAAGPFLPLPVRGNPDANRGSLAGIQRDRAARAERFVVGMRGQHEHPLPRKIRGAIRNQLVFFSIDHETPPERGPGLISRPTGRERSARSAETGAHPPHRKPCRRSRTRRRAPLRRALRSFGRPVLRGSSRT